MTDRRTRSSIQLRASSRDLAHGSLSGNLYRPILRWLVVVVTAYILTNFEV